MRKAGTRVRVRYPLRAFLAVGGAWLLLLVQILAGAFFAVLMIPLVPVFLGLVLATTGLLTAAHEYAASVATPMPWTKLPHRDAEVAASQAEEALAQLASS